MFNRILNAAFFLALIVGPADAGIYNTTDAPQETARLSPDFDGVFRDVLLNLRSIPDPTGKPNPPIRRRYLLMETLGSRGQLDLRSLEAKLDYSTVLIRRGKIEEAVMLLKPLAEEHDKNFVILSQCATAHFLASQSDLKASALDYLHDAMRAWPEQWEQVAPDQKNFLINLGWEETAFARNRKFETYLDRLMSSRAKEERKKRNNELVPETVDPIFGSPDHPVRFVNDKGEFTVGMIPASEMEKLPRDAWDIVEQLLLWMPNDDRLLWLLGEVFNAEVMNQTKQEAKNLSLRSAQKVFEKLRNDAFGRVVYGRKQIEPRYEALTQAAARIQDRIFEPEKHGIKVDGDDDKSPSELTNEQWWRVLIVGALTGFVVGLFTLWQFQEMRRRRGR